MAEFDLVIRGGLIVDGNGGPPVAGDVAITDGVIREVGAVSGTGSQEINADGAVVSPGFVDVHTHYDAQVTWSNHLDPSSWHGVTTVVMGNCGVGFAPALPANRDRLVELMEGVEDIPGVVMREGLPWTWTSFEDYLDVIAGREYDIDVAAQLPHAPLRVQVMGERAAAHADATADDIELMSKLAARAIEAGAIGFSTSRSINHKSVTGELTPSYEASASELVSIARAIGKTGKGVLQLVSDWPDVDADFRLMRAMVNASSRPLSMTFIDRVDQPERYLAVFDQLDKANAAGLPIRGQVPPRGIGLLLGLQCTLNPFMTNAVYKSELQHLPVSERTARMAQPDVRTRVLAAQTDEIDPNVVGGALVNRWHQMFELGNLPNYELDPNLSIAKIAERQGRAPAEVAYDLLIADEGKAMVYLTSSTYAGGSLDTVYKLLTHPHTIPGLSDGGAHVATICDASFPTTLLQHWVRDRDGERLGLPFAIKRQARDTAWAVGLTDRGVLAPGFKADINVIDLDGLRVHRPEMHYDLPSGGKRLMQRADGYKHTVVSGVETYRDGQPTGALPGRLVRS